MGENIPQYSTVNLIQYLDAITGNLFHKSLF